MERFWNIIHYITYLGYCKFGRIVSRPLLPLYKLPFAKRNFEKRGIKDPVKELYKSYDDPEIGISEILAGGLMYILPMFFLFLLVELYMILLGISLNAQSRYGLVVSVCGILSFLTTHSLLFYKDKYLGYFREFSKMSHTWRKKWAVVSFFTIISIVIPPILIYIFVI